MKGRDLIHIGIFSAICFVIVFIAAVLGFIPVFLPLLCVHVPILGGLLGRKLMKKHFEKAGIA